MSVWIAGALADAGNPILNTINGKIVSTPKPSYPNAVTVYVRGQWNWLSHNKDCNLDRNGTGVGMIWNDPSSPGFTVTKGSLSAGVGVASSSNGLNAVDEMVHPTDVGDDHSGNGSGRFVNGVEQTFNDAGGDSTPSPNNYQAWRSGCGREPFADGDPYGSWGYDKNLAAGGDSSNGGGQGFKHVYASRADVTTVCVNFYDVHGSNAGFQAPNGAKEIDVNGNGDNSIQTNAFNVNQGANCINFPFIKSTTPVTNVTVGSKIHDTATVAGASPTQQTKLTFHLFGPGDTDCSKGSIADSGPFTVTGNDSATSDDYDTTPTAGAGAGTYQWTVELTNLAGDLLDTSGCGKEPSVVTKSPTRTDTTEALKVTEHITVTLTANGTSKVAATGDTRIRLFKGTCTTNSEDNGTTPLYDQTLKLDAGNTKEVSIDITSPGDFYWFVQYLGDTNSDPSNDDCTETFSVHFPVL